MANTEEDKSGLGDGGEEDSVFDIEWQQKAQSLQ